MRDPRVDGLSAEPDDAGDPLGELYAEYVDRLNRGESIDPDEILAAHPEEAPELLEMLESFIGPEADWHPPPTQFADYSLARRIGRGGMGVVYDAWQHSMNRRVALKVLPAAVAADPRASARFMREAQTAGQLNHPNIVHVHGLGIEESTPYYAMEYVEGETLARILAGIKKVEPEADTPFGARDGIDYFGRLARAFVGVAEGLHHAHSKGVVHRDIKPSNLILDPEGRLRVLDFGLARFEGHQSLTVSGDFLGTPLYMSPEQARRTKIGVDHRTDVYSLGATMYEAVCGRPPFVGRDHADTVTQIIERDPVEPVKINPRVPRDLETIVLKCLRKDPGERYRTAGALAQDVARFVKGEPIEAKPEAVWMQLKRKLRRHRVGLIATATVLVAIVIVTWLAFSMSRAEYGRQLALYPGKLGEAVAKLESGEWVLRAASPPLSVPGIDFRIFEPSDFRDVIDIAGRDIVREAIDDLQALARTCPGQPETHYHLGRAYAVTGDRDLALVELDRALDVDPGFLVAALLRGRLAGDETSVSDASTEIERPSWLALWSEADGLRRRGDPSGAAEVLTRLITSLERGEPPYTGFLTECYLARASARLANGEHDLAEEDCVRARASNPASLASELLLGTVYLAAEKPALARRAFSRLRSRQEILDVLPFWVVSSHLKVPESDLTDALGWARSVRDEALRERLTTYLYLRLGRWDDAVAAGERAVEADPHGLVPRQLRAAALIKNVAQGSGTAGDSPGDAGDVTGLELARACRAAIELDPENRRSRYLVRAGWELLLRRAPSLRGSEGDLQRAREILIGAARAADLELPTGVPEREIVDDFTADPDALRPGRGRGFSWRIIDECCPAEVEPTADGLRVSKLNAERRFDGWLVTEEVFSGDVTVQVRADVGEGRVFCNLHVDLGTASLYYVGVFRGGRCVLGRLEYAEEKAEVDGAIGPVNGGVILELRTIGGVVEARVWRDGSPRPDDPTLRMEDTALRLGSIGISTSSRPALFRRVHLRTNAPEVQ